MAIKEKNSIGSNLDDWLESEGDDFKKDVYAGYIKRKLVYEIRKAMEKEKVGINYLQEMLNTSPSQMQRILNPDYTGITLKSIARVFDTLGYQIDFNIRQKN